MRAGAGIGGDGVCGEDPDLDADMVGDHGDGGGFDSATANGEAYAGLVHGIASRPKSKPKPPATPATGPPPQPHPPTPGTPLPRPWWPSPPPLTGKARYVDCVLALIQ